MSQFELFILKQLETAGVAKEHRQPIFLNNQEKFIRAFTHKSFPDSRNIIAINRLLALYGVNVTSLQELRKYPSYETMEFKGDLYLKTVHGKILADRYPISAQSSTHPLDVSIPFDGMDQEKLTFAFQKLIGEKMYAVEAERLGLFQFILISEPVLQQAIYWKNRQLDKLDPELLKKYWKKGERVNIHNKLLEDTLEALACAIVESVDAYTDSIFGPGMAMLYRWSLPFFDHLTFDPTNLAETKAKGMVLRELWEAIYPGRFDVKKVSNEMMFEMNKAPGKAVEIRAVDPVTHEVVARTTGVSEKEARAKAAEIAVAWLYKWKSKEIEAGKAARERYRQSHK